MNDPLRVERYEGSEDPFFTDARDREGKALLSRRPQRVVDDLRLRTHDFPNGQGEIARIYPHAIELSSSFYYPWLLSIMCGFLWLCGFIILGMGWSLLEKKDLYLAALGVLICFPFGLFLLLASWSFTRMFIWSPKDRPMLFNRKTRQFVAVKTDLPSPFNLFARPRTRIVRCKWEDLHVRTYRLINVNAAGATAYHNMRLLFGSPDAPHTLADFVPLGPSSLNDSIFFREWEHIRRYMEEDGPPILKGDSFSEFSEVPTILPKEVIDAAGGRPLTEAEVAAVAGPGYDNETAVLPPPSKVKNKPEW